MVKDNIPIQNLYYLLVYAWDKLDEAAVVDVSGLDVTRQVDLFGSVLIQGIRHLSRRGLEQGYHSRRETIPGVRGRINMAVTASRALPPQGFVHCEFDELTFNTLSNQILRSTIYHLSCVYEVDPSLRHQLSRLYQQMDGIDCPPIRKSLFRQVQHHGNARFYRFLLSVCELVVDSLLVDEQSGRYRFRDFVRDDKRMASVFEAFLYNFYRIECRGVAVKKDRIKWMQDEPTKESSEYLPTMETDISLRNGTKTLIIDAKYYTKTLTTNYERERVHSSHLYQLFAYLKNLEQRQGPDATAEGMLLYPAINKRLRLDYKIHGHRMKVCTVDLSAHWTTIKEELLELTDYLNS
ncbi:MAG: 5-methylcytosine-specific restriction endonuclease system specificity protein McrC [Saccharospirillum sp.]|uniref:5-methylcytosine-specific restriction endonuclease system specificity protein McrC n=1 Tax=Saccharospirillum sp. TaxID=2033801 RepID=UPI0032998C37